MTDKQELPETEAEQIQEIELSEVEQKAHALGWRPQGEYSGSNFVDADEYVRRQPLFERIDKQKQELLELREMVKQTTSGLSSIKKESYEAALRDLEAKRNNAVHTGDVETFNTFDRQMKEVQNKIAIDPMVNAPIQAPTVPKEAIEFKSRNSHWYNNNSDENQEMVDAANQIDQFMAQQANKRGLQLDPAKHLKAVEDRVKALYPHRFENVKQSSPAAVGRSTTSTVGKSSNLVSQLTPEQLALGEHFARVIPNYTLEKYATTLQKQGNLGKHQPKRG